MNTQQLITALLQNQEGVNPNDVVSRARTLRNIQRIFNKVINDRNWSFKYAFATLTFNAGRPTMTELPSNWLNWGPSGGLFLSNRRGKSVSWINQWKFLRLLENRDQDNSEAFAYTELGAGGSALGDSDGSGQRNVAIYPTLTSGTATYDAYYMMAPPILADVADGALNFIPPTWHNTVLFEGAEYMRMKDVGNIQSRTEQNTLFMDELKIMRNEERGGKQEDHRIVPFNPFRNRRLR